VKALQDWKLPIRRVEFVGLLATLMALNALAIDIMIPGMQQIGADLGEPNPNLRQLVITAYLIGFGLFHILFGPLSDRFGRKIPLLSGLGIYVAAALAAIFSPNFAILLVLRFIQGAGAAATRVLAVAMARDVAGGRQMAEIMSLIMMVFMIMPVIAPAAGQLILLSGEWRLVFLFMAAIGLMALLWTALRVPETLTEENRREFNFSTIFKGFHAVATHRVSLWYTLAAAFMSGALFGLMNSAQQIYVGIYGLGIWFPVVFAIVAGVMACAAFLNSRIVSRFGMRRISHMAASGFFLTSCLFAILTYLDAVNLAEFIGLLCICMFLFGLTNSNFRSIAMEAQGHLAGTASSVQGLTQTVGGATIGATIGQAFNGTVHPFAVGFALTSGAALICVLIAEKGRLYSSSAEFVTSH